MKSVLVLTSVLGTLTSVHAADLWVTITPSGSHVEEFGGVSEWIAAPR